MMRDEGQMSSDFQEYTLIALFSLAAHLAGGVAAERASLPAHGPLLQPGRGHPQPGTPCPLPLQLSHA